MTTPNFTLPLADGRHVIAQVADDGNGSLTIEGIEPVHFFRQDGHVRLENLPVAFPVSGLLALLGQVFCNSSRVPGLEVSAPLALDRARDAVREGVFDTLLGHDGRTARLACARSSFWQHPLPWLTTPSAAGMPLRYTFSGDKRHPQRPPIPHGEVYRRELPGLKTTFTLRTVDIGLDLERFNRWMNLEQVAFFWEQTGTPEEHAEYLQHMLDDPRVLPLIGSYDGEPFAYFEIYWCKEDRIAPYYDAQDHDRGWHVVVGESKHQSAGKLKGWFRSLMHYMFIDEPRTQRILGEPRIDHTRQIGFLESQGYGRLKTITLPHKQAALLRLERETFFDEYCP